MSVDAVHTDAGLSHFQVRVVLSHGREVEDLCVGHRRSGLLLTSSYLDDAVHGFNNYRLADDFRADFDSVHVGVAVGRCLAAVGSWCHLTSLTLEQGVCMASDCLEGNLLALNAHVVADVLFGADLDDLVNRCSVLDDLAVLDGCAADRDGGDFSDLAALHTLCHDALLTLLEVRVLARDGLEVNLLDHLACRRLGLLTSTHLDYMSYRRSLADHLLSRHRDAVGCGCCRLDDALALDALSDDAGLTLVQLVVLACLRLEVDGLSTSRASHFHAVFGADLDDFGYWLNALTFSHLTCCLDAVGLSDLSHVHDVALNALGHDAGFALVELVRLAGFSLVVELSAGALLNYLDDVFGTHAVLDDFVHRLCNSDSA